MSASSAPAPAPAFAKSPEPAGASASDEPCTVDPKTGFPVPHDPKSPMAPLANWVVAHLVPENPDAIEEWFEGAYAAVVSPSSASYRSY